MSAILEHADHRKAGRAVVIVSTMYILLDQCTSPFNTIGLLGMEVRITSQEFNWLLWAAVCLYFGLFVLRLFQSGIFYWAFEVFNKNVESRAEIVSNINDYVNQRHRKIVDWKASKVKSVTHQQLQRDRKMQVISEQEQKKHKFNKFLNTTLTNSAEKYKIVRNYVDFALMVLVEAGIPILFFIVAYAAIADTRVCPSFAAYKDLLALVP